MNDLRLSDTTRQAQLSEYFSFSLVGVVSPLRSTMMSLTVLSHCWVAWAECGTTVLEPVVN